MAAKKTGLGRGLGSLIPQGDSSAQTAVKERPKAAEKKVESKISKAVTAKKSTPEKEEVALLGTAELLLSEIVANPGQPRVNFSHQELEELTESIREHGVLQPLAVTPVADGGYEIVAGERRFRAAKMAGLEKVPVIVRETEGSEKLVLALIENIQREDLNPIEEARAYERLIQEFGLTQAEVAKEVGKGRSTVANLMRLLDLPSEIRDAVETGKVSAGSARALISVTDEKERMRLFRKLMSGGMSTRDVESDARKSTGKTRKDASVMAVEEELRNRYGTKVAVTNRQGKGKIAISFYSDEEFQDLVGKLLS
jgi:ParB family chromosome partitioning protein